MVWKQDLAKLKQTLKEEEGPLPALPPPLPKPKLADFKPIEDEDALFLSAMGLRKKPAPPVETLPGLAPTVSKAREVAEEPSFAQALAGLKGLKPIGSDPVLSRPVAAPPGRVAPPQVSPQPPPEPLTTATPSPQPAQAAAPVATQVPTPVAAQPPARGPAARVAPLRIHLAAGMAVEVDGVLDLRHHSVLDAEARLVDRLQDGLYLNWRTLQVLLGPDAELQAMFLRLIEGATLPSVARYAQAPIPMGGLQAWILYYAATEA